MLSNATRWLSAHWHPFIRSIRATWMRMLMRRARRSQLLWCQGDCGDLQALNPLTGEDAAAAVNGQRGQRGKNTETPKPRLHYRAARWKCVWRTQPELNNMCLFVCDTSCITKKGEKMRAWDADTSSLQVQSFLFNMLKNLQTSQGSKECKGHSCRRYSCDPRMTFKEKWHVGKKINGELEDELVDIIAT